MAALQECSWQWLPIAEKGTCGCSTTVAHKAGEPSDHN